MTKTLASQEPGLRLLTRHSMHPAPPAVTGERDQRQEQVGAQEPSQETGARHVKEDSLKDLYSFSQELFQMVSR